MLLLLIAGWLAIGALAVAVMRQRGHDAFAWAVPFFFLGPLALPVALSADRHRPPGPVSATHEGRLDVLIAHDGSAEAAAAASTALDLLGPQMTSVTFAAVLDLEATSTVRGREEQRETEARLEAVVRDLGAASSAPADAVVLFGEPSRALQQFAAEHGYELIVAAGGHLAGRSRLAGRRAVWRLATKSSVPVFLGPASS